MREIVLDTETTGLDPEEGHRLVEIGGVELLNHMPTGRVYHQYINPCRDMPEEAFKVHGLSAEFLADKPRFEDVATDFLAFVSGAKLVIHNAAFDMKFLNAELGWANEPRLPNEVALDTLDMARRKFPGAQNSLDALCRRFGVDNSARTKHGALLDSEILAEVYLELLGGRQPGLTLDSIATSSTEIDVTVPRAATKARPKPLPSRLTNLEKAAHAEFIEKLSGPLWQR